MLQALFHRAEATVEHMIASTVAKVLVAVPFLIAVGFLTAALAAYLYDAFGTLGGNLAMAGIFAVLGLVSAAILFWPGTTAAHDEGEVAVAPDASASTLAEAEPLLAAADRELLVAAVKTVGPVAAPLLARVFYRNLPLVAAVGVAAFVLSRDAADEATRIQAAE
jgi:hypothetical protein